MKPQLKRYSYHVDPRFLYMQCEDKYMALRMVTELLKLKAVDEVNLHERYTNPSIVALFDAHPDKRGYVDVTRKQGFGSDFQPYVTREEKIDNLLD